MSELSILCITRAERYARRFVGEIIAACKQLEAQSVIAIDFSGDGEDGDRKVAFGQYVLQHEGVTLCAVYSRGYLESVLDDALISCSGKYVLRLDDDERMPAQMIEWLRSGAYKERPHWKFSRAHLWGDEQSFIAGYPLWPDHQTRLSWHKLSGNRTAIHSGSPYGGGELAPCLIEHHKFLVKSATERREIVKRYDRIAPGMGTAFAAFSVPEDVADPKDFVLQPLATALSEAVVMHGE